MGAGLVHRLEGGTWVTLRSLVPLGDLGQAPIYLPRAGSSVVLRTGSNLLIPGRDLRQLRDKAFTPIEPSTASPTTPLLDTGLRRYDG